MMELIQYIIGVGGVVGLVSPFIFYRANNRLKNSQAKKSDVEYLNQILKIQDEKIEDLYKEQVEDKKIISELNEKVSKWEVRSYQYESVINPAHSCAFNMTCPVLEKLKEIENKNEN